jgi:hypothetical protein
VSFEDARAFYDSPLQSLWGLLLVPALWLAWRLARGRPRGPGVDPAAARFVDAYALVFACEALLDPLVTGPLARALPAPFGTPLGLLCVLLGDFRVFLLVCFLAGGRNALRPALREAALLTPVVALFAFAANAVAGAVFGPLPGQALWLIHETSFLAMVALLRREWIAARGPLPPGPREAYLRAATGYVALYYALWAACDVLILAGAEWAWAVRVLPNQLYYGFWVPFVHALFFARSYASTSTSTQASR